MFNEPNLLPSTKGWSVNIMGIDPGSVNTGVTVMEIDFHTHEIIKSTAYTIETPKSKHFNRELVKLISEPKARREALKIEMRELLEMYRPTLVFFEEPFYSPRTHTAFSSLKLVLEVIQYELYKFNPSIPAYKVDPPSAKKAIGAKGNADKDAMLVALDKVKEKFNFITPFEELTEHSIDSSAIAYWGYINRLERNPLYV